MQFTMRNCGLISPGDRWQRIVQGRSSASFLDSIDHSPKHRAFFSILRRDLLVLHFPIGFSKSGEPIEEFSSG
jgi:hypothetical protein